MKILKKILIVLLVIIAIPLIMALFVSNEFKGENTVKINKPVQEVYDYVKYLDNQENFGVWFQMDPNMKTTSEGIDGTSGYTFKWVSDVVGNGSQTITSLTANDSVISSLDFGFGPPAKGYFHLKELGPSQTEVTWGVIGKSPYPWNLMGLFMDMNKDFVIGTQNLKKAVEAQKSPKTSMQELAGYYRETYENLLKSIAGLSESQLNFKPHKDRWSIAQCVEHLAITAPELFEYEKKALNAEENPERKAELKMKDEDIKSAMSNREKKAQAPEAMQPSTTAIDVRGRLNQLKNKNDEIISYLNTFTEEQLRNRILDAPFGAVDAYQFALFIPGHTVRHMLQIEEVKADVNFPQN